MKSASPILELPLETGRRIGEILDSRRTALEERKLGLLGTIESSP